MRRGAWGGTRSRGGYHLRGPRPLPPEPCPTCGGAMVLARPSDGRFLIPGALPVWTCPTCQKESP